MLSSLLRRFALLKQTTKYSAVYFSKKSTKDDKVKRHFMIRY